MKLVLKLGLSIYVIMVLGFSAFSEANTSFTEKFLQPTDSQVHLEITGVFEEDVHGNLFFYADNSEAFLVSPQSFSNFSAHSLELPQEAGVSGFLVGTHNSVNQAFSATLGILYIFNVELN